MTHSEMDSLAKSIRQLLQSNKESLSLQAEGSQVFSIIVSIALRMLEDTSSKKEEISVLRQQIDEAKVERDSKVRQLEGEIRELRAKLEEAGESATKS